MEVTTDDLLKELGNPGKVQVFLFFLLAFNYFPIVFNNVIMAVFGSKVPFHCDTGVGTVDNVSEPLQMCDIYGSHFRNGTANETKPCTSGWIYRTTESTVVTEWDLVCEDGYLMALAPSVAFAGFMVGGFLFGFLSDHVGRKPIILLTLYGNVVIGVGLFFTPYYTLFVVLVFLQGSLTQGLHTTSHAVVMEIFRPSHRTVAGTVLTICWGLGYIALAGTWYFIQDWRFIELAITLPSVLTIVYIWLLPESLRWLLIKKKFDAAEKVVKTITKYNDLPYPKVTLTLIQSQMTSAEVKQTTTRYTILDLFRTPVIRWRSLRLIYTSFSANIVYSGLSLGATHLPGDKFLNFFISGVVELPAYVLGIFILRRFGRRIPLALYFGFAGVACIASAFVYDEDPTRQTASVVLAMCGKFCAAGIFTAVFLVLAELHPTVIRNIGSGTGAACVSAGGLVAPQILRLRPVTFQQLPFVIFGGFALVAGMLVLTLPETNNTQLPDKIEDVEHPKRTTTEMEIKCPQTNMEETATT